MSAIGDYVHYNAQNYKTWGITRPKGYSTPSHYVNSFHNYTMNKRMSNVSQFSVNYADFENELKKNSVTNLMRDQQLVNLDYGQKIGQFRSMIMARATKSSQKEYPRQLSNKSKNELLGNQAKFMDIQKDIDYVNSKLEQGETVSAAYLEHILQKYKSLGGGSRTSILGNVQQGLNDYAAKVWKKTLDGTFGAEIDKYMDKSVEAYITNQLKNNITSNGNMIVEMDSVNENIPVVSLTDETGSKYSLSATKEGWEIKTEQNRENIMKGSMQNIYDGPGYSTFTLEGQVPLMTVLGILENENRFSTHWLNRHASHIDSSLDEDLKTAISYEAITRSRTASSSMGNFVYIDRTIGQIEHMSFWNVMDMADFNIYPNLAHYKFANEWAAPAEPSYKGSVARINSLISEVHSINMQVISKSIAI